MDGRAEALRNALRRSRFSCSTGYFNGHYHLNEAGTYQMDRFPIPVISVADLCDIEIDLERTSVTTKLTKDNAVRFDYQRLAGKAFEAYGVEDYLADYYAQGDSIETLIGNIVQSKEDNIGFSFYFERNADVKEVTDFVAFLGAQGFFY